MKKQKNPHAVELGQRVRAWRYDQLADRHTVIVKAQLGNDAGIIGAALLGAAS